MIIRNNQTLREIQTAFQAQFPFLKIEFYDTAHSAGEGSPACQQILNTNQTIAEIKQMPTSRVFEIDGDMKVVNLERNFYEIYGIDAQVFRNSGGAWLQTTVTDYWTLNEQNNKAKELFRVRGI